MKYNTMLALVAVALVALVTPQVEAGCMTNSAVDDFFRVVVRGNLL